MNELIAEHLLHHERNHLTDRLGSVRAELAYASPAQEIEPQGGSGTFLDPHEPDILRLIELDLIRQLEEVDAALGRLGGGTYGRCVACGEAIADVRLEVLPWTRLCMNHQI